jgi:uncharacterized Rossmann fold enzyme
MPLPSKDTTMTDYPRIVRGYYYMPEIAPSLYVIETSGRGTPGDGEILLEEDGLPRFFTLTDAQNYIKGINPDTGKHVVPETDIFNHLDDFDLTDRMYIVAPGKNGAEHYHELDPSCFTIIVNKAIQLPLARRDLWMIADPTVYNLKRGVVPWFAEGMARHTDIACFDSHAHLPEYFKAVKYTHEWAEEINTQFIEPTKNRMHGGITISGRAVQMAYWLGAKEIVLCGVDLEGHRYFDDTERGTEAQHHTAWVRVLPLMQQLCEWIQAHGVAVYSMSRTALDIPRWRTTDDGSTELHIRDSAG